MDCALHRRHAAAAGARAQWLPWCDRVWRPPGNLAIAAAAVAHFAESIVWDLVPDGAAHVAQLDSLQVALRVDPMRFDTPSAEDAAGQWLGLSARVCASSF